MTHERRVETKVLMLPAKCSCCRHERWLQPAIVPTHGSFMTNVHEAVIAVRSAIKGVDRDSLTSFASGEENIVKQYDDALAQDDIHAATLELLNRQKSALLQKIAEMEAMADGR